ncbi:FAS1-like dehydratase domain-containing protein [Pararhodobacter zhoushanensis]|uniref:MaoC family dehydratase N-terminal domain-containing protein n=1 Tax=Pararhodobacter zhoushanensis TaxID=2479545 RepID=A0ABT3GTA5_9RHOB|nr:MaoC family dehydratase N-terminal domain-containing protein [Pararhodobacter zhoushanensis]MCW1930770.1 MaoC family dehydratase N-terminal domain-containing protein [Pararhodobacter zhoushanensis]
MSWQPTPARVSEVLRPFPAQAMAATLNRGESFAPGDPLPPLWHWFHALPVYPLDQAGPDGHQALGHFLPPLPLPRRMWAGGQFTFHRPLRIGAEVTRTSVVTSVVEKAGRSGPIAFVTVAHRWRDADGPLITEAQDIVYRRADAPPGAVERAPAGETLSREMTADPVLLFRYSALTFNGHRIHYDRAFCATEGYDGLVVHGPLLATLLLDLLRVDGGALPQSFRFRAKAPITDGTPFTLCGRIDGAEAHLWVRRADGVLAMEGWAGL